jgi:hypothetical protein
MERTSDPVRDAERYFSDLEDIPRKKYTAAINMTIYLECEGTCQEDAKKDAKLKANILGKNIYSMREIIDTDVESVRIEED